MPVRQICARLYNALLVAMTLLIPVRSRPSAGASCRARRARGQVVADAALAAALRSRPLVVTLLAGDGPGATARPPRALGSAEVDLAPLLHPRWARLGPGFAAHGTGVSWRHATGHMHLSEYCFIKRRCCTLGGAARPAPPLSVDSSGVEPHVRLAAVCLGARSWRHRMDMRWSFLQSFEQHFHAHNRQCPDDRQSAAQVRQHGGRCALGGRRLPADPSGDRRPGRGERAAEGAPPRPSLLTLTLEVVGAVVCCRLLSEHVIAPNKAQ